jgi:uncharacterized membrane protein
VPLNQLNLLQIPKQLLIKPQGGLVTLRAYPFINAMKANRVSHGTELDNMGLDFSKKA